LKKPQALIGLLAALGTAIGVLIAVVGLPYGRADYTAFADLYHNGGTPALGQIHLALDCDTTTATDDAVCNIPVSSVAPIVIGVTIGNNTAGSVTVGTYNFVVVNPDSTKIAPTVCDGAAGPNPPGPVDSGCAAPPAQNANPDDQTAGGSCHPPQPQEDDGTVGGGTGSFLSCFGKSVPVANTPLHVNLANVTYSDLVVAPTSTTLTLRDVAVSNTGLAEIASCNPTIDVDAPCFSTTLNFFTPTDTPTPTNTNTAAPTDTFTPTNTATATNTFTPTNTATPTPLGASMIKIPESCVGAPSPNCDDSDPQQPSANLFICQSGPCAGKGEGNLIVFEYATNVDTGDQNNDTIEDGVGAYEFDIEYDNFVIASVNPCDMVFSPTSVDPNNPGGSDGVLDPESARGPVDEQNAQNNNPYCFPDVGGANNGTCAMSIITENVIHFGCVTSGQLPPGPEDDFDMAALNLIPHEDLAEDLFPGNDNGVVTIIKDNGCEIVDVFGHPVSGSVNGGLLPVCGDVTVTIRILEGDMDLDCDVDVSDEQAIAWRYGAFFGSLLYSKWFDLEPNTHDLDIDIKDLQKVFGRDGSTCQNPVPAQTPVPFF